VVNESRRVIRGARSAGKCRVRSAFRAAAARKIADEDVAAPLDPGSLEVLDGRGRGARQGPSRPRSATRSFRPHRQRAPAERAADHGGAARRPVPRARLRGRSRVPSRHRSRPRRTRRSGPRNRRRSRGKCGG